MEILENHIEIKKGKLPKNLSGTTTEKYCLPYVDIKAFEKNNIARYTDGEKCLICENDDILLVWDGARCGLVGKAIKGAVGSTLALIKPKPTITRNYLYYFLQSLFYKLNTDVIGIGIPHLNPFVIRNSQLIIPPLSEQQLIVSKIEELLSELENGKQQLQTAQQQLKVYRQSLLKAAFEGKLTKSITNYKLRMTNDELKITEKELNHGNHNNQINHSSDNLPNGWKWVKLGDVASKITDGEHITPKRTLEGYYLLSARNIQNGYLALDNVDYIPFDEYERIIKRCNPEPDDILISCSGSIGRVCRVPANIKFTMVRSVALVKFDWKKYSSKFYEYLFQSPLLQRQIEKSKKATAQANLFLGPMKDLDVLICPLEEQHRIVSILESKLTVCDKIEETIGQSLQQAETLRQSILKKAFEGTLI